MYWDTLGPRWPLYADMSDSVVSRRIDGDDSNDDSGVVQRWEVVEGNFGGAATAVLRCSGSGSDALALGQSFDERLHS